ncbi:MAG: hypothetical protein M0C28_12180 [Candidatus Moduliflexus flocculans]|nr:hypothetical protein [Candidatus Moduliflexus flocculans]
MSDFAFTHRSPQLAQGPEAALHFLDTAIRPAHVRSGGRVLFPHSAA